MLIHKLSKVQLAAAVLALSLMSCRAVQNAPRLTLTPNAPRSTSTGSAVLARAATVTPSAAPAATRTPVLTETSAPATSTPSLPVLPPTLSAADPCGYSPLTRQINDTTSPEAWMAWVKQLSGAEPVSVGGEQVTITTRLSSALFNGQPNGRAFDFVVEQVRGWYPDSQIQVMPYTAISRSGSARYAWKNLVVTLPGTRKPGEIVILSAHLDSTSRDNPEQIAPGAEDNASGSATLLEAARIFRDYRFERTIQIVWFTGEEQGLLGSKAFVETVNDPKAIAGVVNLDMFGYDSDGDRCFEMHVGELPQSDAVGQCFVRSADVYALGLPHYDYLTDHAVHGSDHSSFWEREIGAIEILENMFDNGLTEKGQPNACANADPDPNYHTPGDTYEKINAESAIRIVRAALATVAGLAGPVEPFK